MRYCSNCVLPDTRPGIYIREDGICNACAGHDLKSEIDWAAREQEFLRIIELTKGKKKGYDCIVPVSGGKDSTWQVVRCLEYGLKTLAVTWRTPGRTEIGQQNLNNLINLGVDHIDYTIDPRVDRLFTYKTLFKTGSTAVPMHMGMYTIPLRIAVSFDIPLVIWGESPFMEYGGTEEERNNLNRLDNTWLKMHGILQGTSAEDWVDDELSVKDMTAFYFPNDEEFRSKNILSLFLGYYFPWDPEETLRVAKEHGFQVREEGPKVGYYNFADIDCDFISVHHHFKWLKFGFSRLFDNLSLEIRNGRMTRDEAVQIIRERGDQRPNEDIDTLCNFLNISEEHFREIEEKFRNTDVWEKENGVWKVKDFLIPDWKWD
ncbi:MAG: N-acetyl sugar amidotransferase [Acidobacteriota bacterium]